MTNLNGARIFRVVQQPDRAVVFPLKIPDAATHKSAQHLSLPGFAALRLQDQNNKLEHQRMQVNVTLTAFPGPLNDQPPRQAPLLSR